ncbi:MAG: hypothetical protein AAGA18_00510 [Verrucomicrobiota bacterium]
MSVCSLLLLGLLGSFAVAYKKFYNKDQTTIFLEDRLGLNNQMTCASRGVGNWPEPLGDESFSQLYRWKWINIIPYALGAGLILVLSCWVPIHSAEAKGGKIVGKPPELEHIEKWSEILEKAEVVEETAMERLKKQIGTLSNKDSEEWYRHGSLEAVDKLEGELASSISEIQKNFSKLQNILKGQRAGYGSREGESSLNNQLQSAIDGLDQGDLPLNRSLMEKLKNMSQEGLDSLTQQEMDDLQKQLHHMSQACQKCQSSQNGVNHFQTAKNQSMGLEETQGGINRGPGSVPLTLNPRQSDLGSQGIESISNKDAKRAAMGRMLGTSKDAHDVKEQGKTAALGGEVNNVGGGGESVWIDRLKPKEQALVKGYFQ